MRKLHAFRTKHKSPTERQAKEDMHQSNAKIAIAQEYRNTSGQRWAICNWLN